MACYGHKHGDMGRDVVIGVFAPVARDRLPFFVGGSRHLFESIALLSAIRRWFVCVKIIYTTLVYLSSRFCDFFRKKSGKTDF